VKDDLTPYLETLPSYDVIAFATPRYWMAESGMMRCCLERILFPFLDYDVVRSKYPGKTKTAYLATMNVPAEFFEQATKMGCTMERSQDFLKMIFGHCESVYAMSTLQVDDYKKYHITIASEEERRAHRKKQFPIDLHRAFELGARLVKESQ
jgi:multimeric flavodoxin WrbA